MDRTRYKVHVERANGFCCMLDVTRITRLTGGKVVNIYIYISRVFFFVRALIIQLVAIYFKGQNRRQVIYIGNQIK